MVFIEGYALNCALGKNAKASVLQLKVGVKEPSVLKDGNKYFHLDESNRNLTKLIGSDGFSLTNGGSKLATTKDSNKSDYYSIMENIAKDAINDANLTADEIKKLGLFIGTSSAKLPLNESILREGREVLEEINVAEVSTILTERLNIQGFSTLISTACTSSANALVQAKEMIEAGLIDKALVLGVELYNELSLKGFDSFLLLSKDKIRPFDKHRDGVILGEGLSAIVLGKKKSSFELCSGAVLLDTASISSPSAEALTKVMQQAIKEANIEPKDISLIKAHATATIHNDAVEADAINALFRQIPKVLSFKPYLGHTMGACGTNELVLLMQALKENFIPKTANFLESDPQYPLQPTLISSVSTSGYSLLNYFGFGGNNCCLVIKYEDK